MPGMCFADGFARKYGCVCDTGRLLDPNQAGGLRRALIIQQYLEFRENAGRQQTKETCRPFCSPGDLPLGSFLFQGFPTTPPEGILPVAHSAPIRSWLDRWTS